MPKNGSVLIGVRGDDMQLYIYTLHLLSHVFLCLNWKSKALTDPNSAFSGMDRTLVPNESSRLARELERKAVLYPIMPFIFLTLCC